MSKPSSSLEPRAVRTANGWLDLLAEGRAARFALICLGVWLSASDNLVTSTIMPSVGREIGGYAYFSWATAGFLIGAILAGASAGRLSELFGLRRATALAGLVMAGGLSALAIASLPSSMPASEALWHLQQYPAASAVVKFGVVFPLAYHYLGGLRHLVRALLRASCVRTPVAHAALPPPPAYPPTHAHFIPPARSPPRRPGTTCCPAGTRRRW